MASAVSERLAAVERDYAGEAERPLGGYLALLAGYGGLVAGLAGAIRRSGRALPAAPALGDLALGAVATHKLARLIAKDSVLSPLRAPFTRYAGVSGEAELAEEVRGHGLKKAVGELVTCPFCLGQWVATLFWGGLVLAPRPTRLLATLAGSDVLQLAYARAEQLATA